MCASVRKYILEEWVVAFEVSELGGIPKLQLIKWGLATLVREHGPTEKKNQFTQFWFQIYFSETHKVFFVFVNVTWTYSMPFSYFVSLHATSFKASFLQVPELHTFFPYIRTTNRRACLPFAFVQVPCRWDKRAEPPDHEGNIWSFVEQANLIRGNSPCRSYASLTVSSWSNCHGFNSMASSVKSVSWHYLWELGQKHNSGIYQSGGSEG